MQSVPVNALSTYGKHLIQDLHEEISAKYPDLGPVLSHTDDPSVLQERSHVPVPKDAKIGIVGGGVGGLYAAMLLESVGIRWEILEASDRLGGRVFTYHFSNKEHDYFDVGPMRFPHTKVMARTFDLFGRLSGVKPIPYEFSNKNTTMLYNGIFKQASGDYRPETFNVPDIPDEYKGYTAKGLHEYVIKPFKDALVDDVRHNTKTGWQLMMRYDRHSVRSYMLTPPIDRDLLAKDDPARNLDPKKLLPLTPDVVDWLETFNFAEGWFDTALTETVLEDLAFAFPKLSELPKPTSQTKLAPGSDGYNPNVPDDKWYCLDGGSSTLIDAMVKYLEKSKLGKIIKNIRVGRMEFRPGDNLKSLEDHINVTPVYGKPVPYSIVVTTATLPCLQMVDLWDCELSIPQEIAVRELQYANSTKIGVKFKSAWWSDGECMPFGCIKGGQSFTDRPLHTIVYPSYGLHGGLESTVLIASYCWTNDANRLSGLIDNRLLGTNTDRKAQDDVLKERVLRDLVAVHNMDPDSGYKFLQEQCEGIFAWAWNDCPTTLGAFGLFGPTQFSKTYKYLTLPAARGHLYFAGEGVSNRHAWIVGALEASYRAVHQIIVSSFPEKLAKFEAEWPLEPMWDQDLIRKHLLASEALPKRRQKAAATQTDASTETDVLGQ